MKENPYKTNTQTSQQSQATLILFPFYLRYLSYGSNLRPCERIEAMNFLIADDHANVRRGLREILDDAFSGAHFSEASSGDEC